MTTKIITAEIEIPDGELCEHDVFEGHVSRCQMERGGRCYRYDDRPSMEIKPGLGRPAFYRHSRCINDDKAHDILITENGIFVDGIPATMEKMALDGRLDIVASRLDKIEMNLFNFSNAYNQHNEKMVDAFNRNTSNMLSWLQSLDSRMVKTIDILNRLTNVLDSYFHPNAKSPSTNAETK